MLLVAASGLLVFTLVYACLIPTLLKGSYIGCGLLPARSKHASAGVVI